MMLKLLVRIPILGGALGIINSYVSGGKIDSDEKVASATAWFKALAPGILVSILLAAWMISPLFVAMINHNYDQVHLLAEYIQKPGQLSVNILPNILGFGIGVYAFIFMIPDSLIKQFDARISINGRGQTALAINADMAFPLLIIAVTILAGLIQQRFPASLRWIYLCWGLLWYSLILAIGLISTIFRLGEFSILEKLDP